MLQNAWYQFLNTHKMFSKTYFQNDYKTSYKMPDNSDLLVQ